MAMDFESALKEVEMEVDMKFTELQVTAIRHIVDGEDCFIIWPPGSGKSMVYVIPPIIQQKMSRGLQKTALVISPLISLMRDQQENLKRLEIKSAIAIADMTKEESTALKDDALVVLFSTPEFAIASPTTLLDRRICLLAVDEAHCISDWGFDFRPAYLDLDKLLSCTSCPVVALTATASPDVRTKVKTVLRQSDSVFTSTRLPNRPNIFIEVRKSSNYEKSLTWLVGLVTGEDACRVIVYVENENLMAKMFMWLCSLIEDEDLYTGRRLKGELDIRDRKVAMMKSSTPPTRKSEIESDLRSRSPAIRVLMATSVLGMGVHVQDVTHVVCWGLPKSTQLLWQEMGRAARGGGTGFGALYWSMTDLKRDLKQPQKVMIEKNIHDLVTGCTCPRLQILRHYTVTETEKSELQALEEQLKVNRPCQWHSCCHIHNMECTCSAKDTVYDKFHVQRLPTVKQRTTATHQVEVESTDSESSREAAEASEPVTDSDADLEEA